MRFRVRKMFKRDPATGDLHGATVVVGNAQQSRSLQGKIGDTQFNGEYLFELRGGSQIEIAMDPGTTFSIEPAL